MNYRAWPLDRFKNVKISYLALGLSTRVHGNCKRRPKHALIIDNIKSLVTFITNYSEQNAILLPGRIPGYKRDTIQLLLSSATKKTYTMHTHIHLQVTRLDCVPSNVHTMMHTYLYSATIHTHVPFPSSEIQIHELCTCVHIHVHLYVHTAHVHTYIHIHIHAILCTYIILFTHKPSICIHVIICTHIHTHTVQWETFIHLLL